MIRVYRRVSMLNIFVHNTRMPIEWLPWQRYPHQRLDARSGSFCHHIRQSIVGSSHIWKHFHRLDATSVQMSYKNKPKKHTKEQHENSEICRREK